MSDAEIRAFTVPVPYRYLLDSDPDLGGKKLKFTKKWYKLKKKNVFKEIKFLN